jgi:hypothetical protein
MLKYTVCIKKKDYFYVKVRYKYFKMQSIIVVYILYNILCRRERRMMGKYGGVEVKMESCPLCLTKYHAMKTSCAFAPCA